jgi:hypothetical protein
VAVTIFDLLSNGSLNLYETRCPRARPDLTGRDEFRVRDRPGRDARPVPAGDDLPAVGAELQAGKSDEEKAEFFREHDTYWL